MNLIKKKKFVPGKLSFFSVAHGLVHMITGTLAPVLPLIRNDFNLSYTLIGVFTLILSLTLGIASIPAGVISERVNRFKFISLMFCLIGIICTLLFLKTGLWITLSLLTLLFLCFSAFHPSAQICLFHEYPQKKGTVFGVYESGGNFGLFLAPFVAGFISSQFGWRAVYLIWAIPIFIFSLLIYLVFRKEQEFVNISDLSIKGEIYRGIGALFKRQELGTIFLIQANAGLLWAIIIFLPLFLVDKRGFSIENAGLVLSLFILTGALGKMLGGKLADQWGRKRVLFCCFTLLVPLYISIPFTFGFMSILFLLLLSLVFFMVIPVLLTSVTFFSREGLGFNYGFLTLMGAGSSAISRLFCGLISDFLSMEMIFFMFAIIAMIGAILSLFRLSS